MPTLQYGLVAHPGSVPAPHVAAALAAAVWLPPVGLIGTFLILRIESLRPILEPLGFVMVLILICFVGSRRAWSSAS